MVIAPIWLGLKCPTIAISTIPNKGTVIFVMILGNASPKIFLFNADGFFIE